MATQRYYEPQDQDVGWTLFAGVLLGFCGAFNILDGTVALSKSSFYAVDAHYVVSDLRTWGWIVIGLGVLQVVAAFSVAGGSELARWFGIAVAALNAIAQLMFAQSYPFWAITLFTMDVLVIYALAAHAGKRLREKL
jgi:hypothetical protein